MKKYTKIICIVLCMLMAIALFVGCKPTYFEEEYTNPLADRDVGNINTLTFWQNDNEIALENANTRICLSKQTGGITQYLNKQSKVYLVEYSQSPTPLAVYYKNNTNASDYSEFEYKLITDTTETKTISLTWTFGATNVIVDLSLSESETETVSRLSIVDNDLSNPIVAVEYPIYQEVDTLYQKGSDYFVSPVMTGYLFNDPVTNFNSSASMGIDRETGMYPSGWNVPMQFQGYYSYGIGGFMMWTRDGGDTVKSFTCTGDNGKLKLSIYHYLSDLGSADYAFDYDIATTNLDIGTWQECAEAYQEWATQQSWCQKGLSKTRTDLNRSLYEETTLVNFGYPFTGKLTIAEQTDLYNVMKQTISGKFLNILFSQSDYAVDLTKENDDLLTFFEFNTFSTLNESEEIRNNIIRKMSGSRARYGIVNQFDYYYQCPASESWRQTKLDVEKAYYEDHQVDGFYHDCSISAVHPLQCFDTTHSHGTRVNIVSDAIKQISEAKTYATEQGVYSVGEELIFEQLLPYVDYYQSRAGGSATSWMEHDRIMPLVENNSATLIPLFNYVYGAYGALRMDGYLSADILMGGGYYPIAASVALNGGIVEYNYEFLNQNEYLRAEELDIDMLKFVGELGNARLTFGKDYLVYGKMVKAPVVGSGQSVYSYYNKNYQNGVGKRGEVILDDVIVSAYKANGKIAIFLCNVTDKDIDVNFVLNALRDYAITSGNINLIGANEISKQIATIQNGKCKISLTLQSKKVIMLEITE